MKKLAKVWEIIKSDGRRVLAFMLAVATFATSINLDWSSLVVAEAAWTATPVEITLPSTSDRDYNTAIDLTNEGLVFSAGETGQMGAIITPSGSSNYEYPKAVSFCVDVPANTSFTASAATYQNISNTNSISTPGGIAANGIRRGTLGQQSYANESSEIQTVVCTLYLDDCGVRASSSVSETYGIVVNITGTGDLKYYTGSNGNTGERYVNSNTDSSRTLVVTTASKDDDISGYSVISTSWDGVKYMGVGDSTTFTATISEGYKRAISYEISDSNVASIDSSTGVIVANKPGTATVTAKTASGVTSEPKEIAVYNAVFATTHDKAIDPVVYPNSDADATKVTVETQEGTYTDSNFTITYPDDPSSVGTKTIKVDGGSYYPGFYQELTYDVVAQEMPTVEQLEAYRDAGKIIIDVGTNEVLATTAIKASDDTTDLVLGTDYTATASNKVVSGNTVTYDVTFTGIGNYTGTRTITNVNALNATPTSKLDISNLTAWIDDSEFVYNNSNFSQTDTGEILSNLHILDGNGEEVAIQKSNIRITSIKRNGSASSQIRNAGDYTITITGDGIQNGIYTGSIEDIEFSVAKRPLTLESGSGFTMTPAEDEAVSVLHESDSTKITPTLSYNNGIEDLALTVEDGDIEYSYVNDNKIGNATVTISATENSNFTGYVQKTYTIVPNINLESDISISINGKSVTRVNASDSYYTATNYNPIYSGNEHVGKVTGANQTAPTIVVKNKSTGKTLKMGVDYTVEKTVNTPDKPTPVFDNTNASVTTGSSQTSGSFTFTLAGGLDNSVDVYFTILPKDMTTAYFQFAENTNSLYYTGDPITLVSDQYDVYFNSTPLVEGSDYRTIESTDYADNTDAGTAKIYAEGIGNYTGSIVGYFPIKPRSISATDEETGNPVAPHTAKKKAENYGVQAVMNPLKTVEGIGSGELKKNYLDGDEVILDYFNDTSNPDYDYSLNYVGFSGSTEDFKVNRLSIGKDFTVTYSNNRRVALWTDSSAPTIKVTGKGNFTGTRELKFTIQPASLSSLAMNVNGVPIVNPEIYVPYSSTGSTPSTTGSYVAMEYNGSLPKPTVEFTEKTLVESSLDGNGDYTTVYFDSKADLDVAIDQGLAGTPYQPANKWTKDVNDNGEGYGYKYLLIWGLNNYSGDYKIIQFKFMPRSIEMPSITTAVKTSADPSQNPEVVMYDKGLTDASLKTQKLVEGTDFDMMMYDSTGALVPFEADAAPGDSKEIVIVGKGNYKNQRSVYYKSGINLSAYTVTRDTANRYLDLKDNTGEGDPEHYIKVINPISTADIAPKAAGDSAFAVDYLGQATTPTIQLWRVKQEGEATDQQIFGAEINTSGGIDTYQENDITVTLEKQGDTNGYDAGSIVKVTVSGSPTSGIYYGQTVFYYEIIKADLSRVVFYDNTSLDYTINDQTTETYPVYPYTGGKVSTNIKAKYGDEDLAVNTVTSHTIIGTNADFEVGEEYVSAVDTGIIDKSIAFNTSSANYVKVDSNDDNNRKNYTIGDTGTENPYALAITVDDPNFEADAVGYLPYIIRGIDFANQDTSKAAYGESYSRVVLEKGGEYYTANQTVTYNGQDVTDYTPVVQVKVNGEWVDLNPDTYRCEWVKWGDETTKPDITESATTPCDVGKYTVKIRPFASDSTAISKLGRTAGRFVKDSPSITVGPRATSTDLSVELSETEYVYDTAFHKPGITITDNMGTPDDDSDDKVLVEGVDYNITGYKFNSQSETIANPVFPGTYAPVVVFINNYQGSSVDIPVFKITGVFTDEDGNANTYTDVQAETSVGPYYLVMVDGAVLDVNSGNKVLYLSNGKLYSDESCTNEFNAEDIQVYFQDTSVSSPEILATAPNGGRITDITVNADANLKKPGADGSITITGNRNSAFKGSQVTLTGFTVKANLAETIVTDDVGRDLSNVSYNYDPNAGDDVTVTAKIASVKYIDNNVSPTDYTVSVTGSNRFNTPTTGVITLTAADRDDCYYFGTRELNYSVSLKISGFKVWFSNDESTPISTGTYSVGYDDIKTWAPNTQVLAVMTTKDDNGNDVQVAPEFYTMEISDSAKSFTSTTNSGTVSKFTDGTNPALATAFTPGSYQISFLANEGATLDSSISALTPSFTVNAMVVDHITYDATKSYVYNGGPIKPDELDSTFAVYNKFDSVNPLVKGVDYTITYANNVNAGKASDSNAPTLTVTGIGNYAGSIDYKFTISQKSISGAVVTVPDQYYTGKPVYPVSQVEVTDGGVELARNTHFTIDNDGFTNNIDVSTADSKASVTVNGTGNYKGTATGQFSILPLDFSRANLQISNNECEYTGKRIYGEKPVVTPTGAYVYIKAEDSQMENEGVLKIQVPNPENPSEPITLRPSLYSVTIDGYDYVTDANEYGYEITVKAKPSSNYSGQKTFKYYVHQKSIAATDWASDWTDAENTSTRNNVSQYGSTYDYSYKFGLYKTNGTASLDYDYNGGSGVEPTVKIVDQKYWTGTSTSVTSRNLVQNTDFTVSYDHNTVGASKDDPDVPPTVTITGTGNYTGTVTKTFNIGISLKEVYNNKPRFSVSSKEELEYDGTEKIPDDITVKDKKTGATLVKDTDYTFDASTDKVNAGKQKLVVTGINNYYGKVEYDETDQPDAYYVITPMVVDPTDPSKWSITLNTSGDDVTDVLRPTKVYQSETYKGSECKPSMTIRYTEGENTYTLTGNDFTVDYKNNINANMAWTMSGYTRKSPESLYPVSSAQPRLLETGNYVFAGHTEGSQQSLEKKNFVILPYNLSAAGTLSVVESDAESFPDLTVNDDYAILAFDDVNHTAIKPNIRITFTGADAPAAIGPINASNNDLTLEYKDSSNNEPRDPGLANITVKGANSGNFYGSLSTKYHIVANVESSHAHLELDSDLIKPYTDGTVGYPIATVKYVFEDGSELVLKEQSEYTISAIKDGYIATKGDGTVNDVWKTEGPATLLVSGVNPHFAGTISANYTYYKEGDDPGSDTPEFSKSSIVVDDETTTFVYDTRTHIPKVLEVKDTTGKLLTNGVDYTVTYTTSVGDAKNVGVSTTVATISGLGDYVKAKAVSVSTDVTITAKNIADSNVTFNPDDFGDVTYTGKDITPTTTLRYMGTSLVMNVDYSILYINNHDPGAACVRIIGINNFYGSKADIYFNIKTIKVTGLKVTSTSANSVTLTWTKASNAAGYTVSYMQGDRAKSVSTTGNSVTISGLSSKTTYSFAVRSYINSNSRTYYGDPSKVSATTK